MKHYQPLLTIINQYSSPAFFRWAQRVAITLPGWTFEKRRNEVVPQKREQMIREDCMTEARF